MYEHWQKLRHAGWVMQWNQCAPQRAPGSHPTNIQAERSAGISNASLLAWDPCFLWRSQILERDMEEADPGVLLMLPRCQVRLRKRAQISQFRHSHCLQMEKKYSEGFTVDAWVPFPCRQPTTGAPCHLYLDNPNYWQANHSPRHTDLVCPVTSEKSQ